MSSQSPPLSESAAPDAKPENQDGFEEPETFQAAFKSHKHFLNGEQAKLRRRIDAQDKRLDAMETVLSALSDFLEGEIQRRKADAG